MAIFLMILKIIGIILLVILGIILFVLLLILFVPITYKIQAVSDDDKMEAHVKVGYLIVSGVLDFVKGDGLDYGAKILGFKVFPRGNKSEEEDIPEEDMGDIMELYDDSEPLSGDDDLLVPDFESASGSAGDLEADSSIENSIEENTLEENTLEENTLEENTLEESISEENISEENTSLENNAETANSEDSNLSEDNKTEDDKTEEDITEDASTDTEADIKKEKTSLGDKLEKITSKVDSALDKGDQKVDGLFKKMDEAAVKVDHVMQFLDREFVQRTIVRALKVVKHLLKSILPKKSNGYLHMGLGSAAATGETLGKLGAIYPLYGRWLTIEPDFYNKVIEGNIYIKGRIFLFKTVVPAIGMVLTRDFWRTIKLAKKI